MAQPQVSNPNDFRVVSFHNSTEFGFTPEMGCMYDSRPINGAQGGPGINGGETVILPYHIAHQLALNLAKVALTRSAPPDAPGVPLGVPLWDEARLMRLKESYLTDIYTEEKPVAMTETDRLMAKVEEYKSMVDQLLKKDEAQPPSDLGNTAGSTPATDPNITTDQTGSVYKDKGEVIAELEKRNVAHDKRKSKAELEKLLA